MPERRCTIHVLPGGEVRFLWADDLQGLCAHGKTRVCRASHVEPAGDAPFWTVDLSPVGGPMLTGFATRGAALDAEREYFETQDGAELLVRMQAPATSGEVFEC